MQSAAPQASIRLEIAGGTYYTWLEDAQRAHKVDPALVRLKPFDAYTDNETDEWGDPMPSHPPVNQSEVRLEDVWLFIQKATAQGHTVALIDVALANRRDNARHYLVGLFRPAGSPVVENLVVTAGTELMSMKPGDPLPQWLESVKGGDGWFD